MKLFLSLLSVIILSACSTTKFDEKINCSPKALHHLRNDNNNPKLSEKIKSNNLANGSAVMKFISNGVQNCYQQMLNQGDIEQYNVCAVVSINEQGKISFIDVDDHSKTLNQELWTCMMKTIQEADFSKIQSATLVQPFNLYPRKI
jgi:hypothetical protein